MLLNSSVKGYVEWSRSLPTTRIVIKSDHFGGRWVMKVGQIDLPNAAKLELNQEAPRSYEN